MKVISYNVNGVRAAITKGFYDWLEQERPDVICLQEVKALREDVDLARLHALGYHDYWHSAQKKGYSGVATFSLQPATAVEIGCGNALYDNEGRILRTDFGHFSVLNCYFPSGTTGDERQQFKMQFLDDFYRWAQEVKQAHPNLIVLGDYNIAHQEVDIHDPKGNKNSSGFLPEERAWMTKWIEEGGFTDAFRTLHPDEKSYSWWTFRANARANNKGWRIDYQCLAGDLPQRLVAAQQLNDVCHSDHCPVRIELSF